MTDERKKKPMPQTNKIGLYSQTGEVEFGDVEKMAHALDVQFQKDHAPAHGILWSCAPFSAASDVPPDFVPLVVLSNADQAGALGYHDVDPQGREYGKVFSDDTLKHGGTVLDGDNSVSVTVSHEGLEVAGDPRCNLWASVSDGTMEAYELCDRVESQSYKNLGTEASVSNFLFPAGFDPNAEAGAQRDFLRTTTKDGEVTPGGYRIYCVPGKVQQEFQRLLAGGRKYGAPNGMIHVRRNDGKHVVHIPSCSLFVAFGASFPEYKKASKLHHAATRVQKRCRALSSQPRKAVQR